MYYFQPYLLIVTNKSRFTLVFLLVLTGLSSLFLSSCSTKKNTLVNRTFHNLTSHYNGYFYANESIKEGVAILQKAHKDNYDKILPVFKYGKPEDAKSIYPQMDKAFKKSSLVIERHSMLIKGKEYVKWIDENYFVIGKSHFYKRDYFAGLEVFDYISRQYKNQETRFDARVWMIRTYNELGIFDQASAMIDLLKEDKNFPKRLQGEFAAVQADFFLKQELYTQAIFFLQKAITLADSKKDKARYTYILAQVNEKQNKMEAANKLYAKVIKYHPSYDMTFNARLNVARTTEAGSAGSKIVKRQLQKMIKDEKNKEFLDQIYYSLAEIALREKDTIAGVVYLKQSAQTSITNNDQKARAYLKLGELRFDRGDYPASQAYYDSALVLVSKEFPNYEQLSERKKTLTALVSQLSIVQREDSLQRLAAMSETDRIAYVEAFITRMEEEEKRKKEEEEIARQNAGNIAPTVNQQQNLNTTGGSESAWYFYNPSTLSFGFTEFLKKWGSRKLEDNWRRSNKQTLVTDESGAVVGVADSISDGGVGTAAAAGPAAVKRDKDALLKEIPVTEEQKAKSDAKIIEALYSIGFIYKEQLLNIPKAIQTFEDLLRRYPKNKYTLPLYYQLHRLYDGIGNQAMSDKYKNILLTEHPESEYAQILKNPEFLKQTAAKRSEADQLYQETLEAHQGGNYQLVLTNYGVAEQRFTRTKLFPRFMLLKALAYAGSKDLASYEKTLKEIIVKFPKDPAREEAQELLNGLARFRGEGQAFADTLNPGLYAANPETAHIFMLFVKGPSLNTEKLKIKISDFHAQFFSTAKLEISSMPFSADWTLITVKPFVNKVKGEDYLLAVRDDPTIKEEVKGREVKMMLITADNYPVFLKDKRIEEYEKFYKKNY